MSMIFTISKTVRCDEGDCNRRAKCTEIVTGDDHEFVLPRGWTKITVGTRDFHRCPTCSKPDRMLPK